MRGRARSKATHITLGSHRTFGIRRFVRFRKEQSFVHSHVSGVSGSGKSRFLAWLYLSYLDAGLPATLIDPHGDTTKLVFSHLVARGHFRTQAGYDSLLYLDIPEAERRGLFLPYNPLVQDREEHTIAANFVEALHRAFPELAQGAATFDSLLPRAVRVLLHHKRPLTQLERFFLDGAFRNALLADFHDENVVMFFHNAYEEMRKSDQLTYAGSVLRRAQQLSDLPVLRYSLGQDSNTLKLRQLMDAGRSMLVNLALNEPAASRLLACLLTVQFEEAAKSRASLPIGARLRSHHLIIDEASEFLAQSEANLSQMLSGTRKFQLFVCAANQTRSQTSAGFQGALQNVGLRVVFRQGRDDAEYAARMLGQVEPRSVRQDTPEDHVSESAGMAEQREQLTQDIQDLLPGHAYVSSFAPQSWVMRRVFKHSPRRVIKVKTPFVPDPRVDPAEVQHIENWYLRHCFTPRDEVERQWKDSLDFVGQETAIFQRTQRD